MTNEFFTFFVFKVKTIHKGAPSQLDTVNNNDKTNEKWTDGRKNLNNHLYSAVKTDNT